MFPNKRSYLNSILLCSGYVSVEKKTELLSKWKINQSDTINSCFSAIYFISKIIWSLNKCRVQFADTFCIGVERTYECNRKKARSGCSVCCNLLNNKFRRLKVSTQLHKLQICYVHGTHTRYKRLYTDHFSASVT